MSIARLVQLQPVPPDAQNSGRVHSIGQVYEAFNPAARGVFRRAMAVSRAGVVDVRDLAIALGELAPDECRAAGIVSGPDEITRSGGSELPLVNSPELRKLLYAALAISQVQASGSITVSPAILALALVAPGLLRSELLAVSQALQLTLPDALADQLARPAPSHTRATIVQAGSGSPASARLSRSNVATPALEISEIIRGWLAAQALPAAEQAGRLSELGSQAARW